MVQRYHFNDEYSGYHKNGNFVAYTDYAALEAERDEARVAAAKYKAASDELAARLRAARGAWGYGNDYLGDGDIKLEWPRSDELTDALNGPVPECRECAEMRDEVEQLRVRDIEGGIDSAIAHLERTREVCGRILSRHAEGGSHE